MVGFAGSSRNRNRNRRAGELVGGLNDISETESEGNIVFVYFMLV